MEFYRKITNTQHSNGKPMANMAIYEEKARKLKETRAKEERATMESIAASEKAERRANSYNAAERIITEGLKKTVALELSKFIPLIVMNEAFTRMVIGALPHDEDYVESHKASIEAVNRIFLHHLGGVKYLKETANKTGSYFLQDWYRVVKENSDEILKDKLQQLQDANNEAEVQAVIKSGITPEQADKLDSDIDNLGPEEISELVQNKVLDVVKDESKKQSEDAMFRAELKQRAEEYEEQNNQELNPDDADADKVDDSKEPDAQTDDKDAQDNASAEEGTDPDLDEGSDLDAGNSDAEKETKTESAILMKYLVDPTVVHEVSLFRSMVNSVYHDMINFVKESDEEVIDPKTQPPAPNKVVTSPLNLNMFDVYLSDYQNDLQHVDNLRIANKKPLAGSEVHIDSEDVLAEALAQYTMLETAMTIRLINPSENEIRAVAMANMKHR